MLRAIIIDDEKKGVAALKNLVEKYAAEIKVVATTTQASEGLQLIADYKPEIVFLDINMPEMTGFELLEKLSWKEFNLIFTTAHQEHALKALKVDAIDYLLKPIDHHELKAAITRIIHKSDSSRKDGEQFNYQMLMHKVKQGQRKILIASKAGVEALDISEIICVESSSNYSIFYLSDSRKMLASRTLKEFETELTELSPVFMRVHNSFLINLNKVSRFIKIDDSIIMHTGQEIPLSKSRREAFFNWLTT